MTSENIDIEAVLNYEYDGWDLEKCTIRHYLVELARQCWIEEDSFGGKRPFGNSGWKTDVCRALQDGGWIDGSYDEEGDLYDIDEEAGNRIILAAFDRLAKQG